MSSKSNERHLFFEISKIKNKKIWTEEEDNLLLKLAKQFQEKHWEEISKYFKNKTALQCFSRYNRIRPGIIKGKWTKEEDKKILELVSLYGKSWCQIAKQFKTRNGKQIRDRYLNVLDPSINKRKFTKEEDELLTKLYKENGPKWAEITKYFPHRTTDMIKNRFHSSIKKQFFCQEIVKKYRETKLLSVKKQRQQEANQIEKEFHNEIEDDISLDLNNYKLFEDNDEDNFASSLDNQCTDFSSPAHCETTFFALL